MKKSRIDRGTRRRSQQDREKGEHHAAKAKEARALSKLDNEKSRLNARIRKLIDQGYSPASVAKRLGITERRIETAIHGGKVTRPSRVLSHATDGGLRSYRRRGRGSTSPRSNA